MVNIPGNAVAQKFVGKKFSAKGFFVITDVYFQNMTIRNCSAIMQGSLQLAEKSYSLIRLSVFLKNSLNRRYTPY